MSTQVSSAAGRMAGISEVTRRQRLSCGIGRLACLWVVPLLSAAALATAAEPDLRLVNAVAAQDGTAVRALLKQRVDVNVARADGTTALLYASHWNDIEIIDLLLRAGA